VESSFQRALEFARSIRTRHLRIGPTIEVGQPLTVENGPGPGLSEDDKQQLSYWLNELGPYRKGPFSFFGEEVASHWNSDAKWKHCNPYLAEDPAIRSGDVLDLGCNNGYYLIRLLELKQSGQIYGLDPAPPFYRQFRFLQEMLEPGHPVRNIKFIPADHQALKGPQKRTAGLNHSAGADSPAAAGSEMHGGNAISGTGAVDSAGADSVKRREDSLIGTAGIESAAAGSEKHGGNAISRTGAVDSAGTVSEKRGAAESADQPGSLELAGKTFDAILCWGVIYHRTDPIELLRTIHGALKTGGVLYLESMGIPDDPNAPYPRAILPAGKYAGARGIWHVPDSVTLCNYLHRSGYRDIETLETWDYSGELNGDTGMPVLEEFLDTERPGFLKDGLPAPVRILVRARR